MFDRMTEDFTVQYGWQAGHDYVYCPDFVIERVEAARSAYPRERLLVSDQQIAGMIRGILNSCGITVRNIPSTWTIPSTREATLDALIELSERMNEIEVDIFNVDTIPVVSTAEPVKDLCRCRGACYTELNKIYREEQDKVVLHGPRQQQEKSQARFKTEAEEVMTLIEEYELLIGDVMDEVRQARAITENKLKAFCASPSKQAAYKAEKKEKSSGRKLRKAEETPIYDGNKEDVTPPTPSRRFNMSPADYMSAAV